MENAPRPRHVCELTSAALEAHQAEMLLQVQQFLVRAAANKVPVVVCEFDLEQLWWYFGAACRLYPSLALLRSWCSAHQ